MNWKRTLTLMTAGALVLAMTGCNKQTGDTSLPQQPAVGVAVQVEQVELGSIATENRLSGRVVADGQTMVMVAATAKCTAVYVEAGDEIRAGDKICTLDLAGTIANRNAALISYQSTVDSYNNQKEILEKQIGMLEKNLSDTKALFEIGAASQLEIDQLEVTLLNTKAQRDSALAQLEAGIQNGKAGLEQLEQVLEDVDSQGNVIAPASGTVASLSATENGYVSASAPVAVISGSQQMEITLGVSEALVPKLALGDEAEVSIPSAGVDFVAAVRGIEKVPNMQTQLYTVTLGVPEEVAGLMTGMFADVTFRTDREEQVITVPSQAVLTSGDVRYVFVVENDAAKHIQVETGLTGNGVTQITSGLEEGQQLVTVGQAYLSDGDPVRVVSGEG